MGVEIPHPPDMCNSVKIENWDGQRDIDNGFPLFFVSSKLAPTTGNSSTSFGLMQEEHQQEPYFLRAKLLEAVDADYNVRDMPLILEVLGKLEVLHVSKEILETTRLGKTVNEFRRKVNDAILARRLKDLVKKWRDAVLVNDPHAPQNHFPVNGASSVAPEGGAAGGNRAFPPNFSSKFNSSSLSPRIGAVTNYTNNNNSVHSIPASRNGSSSISNISPNHRNPQLSSSSYATLVSPSASSASPLLNSRSLVSPHKSRSPGGPTLSAFNTTLINSNVFPSPSSHFQSTNSSYAAENPPTSIPTPAPPAKLIDWGDSDGEEEYNQKRIIEEQAEIISQQVQVIEEEYTVADTEPVTTVVVSSDVDVTDITEEIIEDQSSPIPQRVVDEEFVEKYVTEDIPNLNGNHDKDGQFRSWHETLTVESYKSEPLHILPYTIIDF